MNTNDITNSAMVSDRNFKNGDMIAGFLQAVVIPIISRLVKLPFFGQNGKPYFSVMP